MSPSTRGCGLKLVVAITLQVARLSPSTRGCGLKQANWHDDTKEWEVTLHARVWIETDNFSTGALGSGVTLHARVWIETCCKDRVLL